MCKSLDDLNSTNGCSDVHLQTNIKNDLIYNGTRRDYRDEKNSYRDYSKSKDRFLVDRNTYDPKIHENKICNVNVCRLAQDSIEHCTNNNNRS